MCRLIRKLITVRAAGAIAKQSILLNICFRAEGFFQQNGVFGGFFSAWLQKRI